MFLKDSRENPDAILKFTSILFFILESKVCFFLSFLSACDVCLSNVLFAQS